MSYDRVEKSATVVSMSALSEHATGSTGSHRAAFQTPGIKRRGPATPAVAFCVMLLLGPAAPAGDPPPADDVPTKTESVFYPDELLQRLRRNVARDDWAKKIVEDVRVAAQPWVEMSDTELWSLMFGATLPRSWMVWSNGHCPTCQESVPMYNWHMDGLRRPWKTRCPHCEAEFPTNDFAAFYRSGLDEQGVFDPSRADRSLLFNVRHPDPSDPRHRFGVDDGTGYVEGGHCWRFIGAYLIYAQWKQVVLGGIQILAQAYVVTGEPIYARKAGILLDRVADLYPSFDFATQGFNYERQGTHGYLGNWHDACEETRELAMAYDRVFDGIKKDGQLVEFLAGQARRYSLSNPKASFADIQRNIETGILRDALANRRKIQSNYPRTDIAVAMIQAIVGWPANRDEVYQLLDAMIVRATAVDGVTGEKGLANYSAFGTQSLAAFLGEWDRADRGFLERCLTVHPRLHQTYRFHIDTWCLQKYYPLVGDTGWFARQIDQYQGVRFARPGDRPHTFHGDGPLRPSMYTFLWNLYRLTGDVALVQVLYRANDDSVADLPRDLFAEDAAALRGQVQRIIDEQGADLRLGSVNKQQWCLAILRSGAKDDARAVWLNYQAGGGHGHHDGMNLGLFAHDLDLMPEFGYPAVQFGGWGSPRARWYTMSAAHNTVVVDGQNHAGQAGQTTLWADGEQFRTVRASAPGMIPAKAAGAAEQRQFERTVVQVDLPAGFYVLDIFRVAGGRDHTKFMHSHFGNVTTVGLSLEPGEDYGHGTQMRHFRWDLDPRPGWSVDWHVEDRYELLPSDRKIHLRYTGLTSGVQTAIAEGWISYGGYGADIRQEAWIPRLAIRRRATEGALQSTFVGVIEPYAVGSSLQTVRRLPVTTEDGKLYPDSTVAIEVTHGDGTQDLLVAADVENPVGNRPSLRDDGVLVQRQWDVALRGELCLIRRSKEGRVIHVAAANAKELRVQGQRFPNDSPENLFQWRAPFAGRSSGRRPNST